EVPAATRDSVVAVARTLFDGMRAHDSTMVRSTFAPGARFASVDRNGNVAFTPADDFIAGVGRPGAPWDEQMYDVEVRVDGGIATLWTFYTFSLGTELRHCGHDAMQLLRTREGWKIVSLLDTRQTEGCTT